jgi:AcrR family transcriptional regulator
VARRADRHTSESLLAIAVEVFNVRGYDGTSMEDLARAAGITKSSIYHHVTGKEELLRLAVTRALDGLFQVLEEPGATQGAAVDRFAYVIRRTCLELVENLPYVTLLLRVRGNTTAEREALERRREFDHRVADLAAAAIADGDLRDDLDPRLTARLVFGLVNSVVEWYRTGGPDTGAGVADALTSLVLSGLRPR